MQIDCEAHGVTMSLAVTLIIFGQIFVIGARPDSPYELNGPNLILNWEGQPESTTPTAVSDKYKVFMTHFSFLKQ